MREEKLSVSFKDLEGCASFIKKIVFDKSIIDIYFV